MNEVRERPLLYQGPMVRATMAGTKTQTRRVMTYQPGDETTVTVERFHQAVVDRHGDEEPGPEVFGAWWDDGESGLKCPYGAPGDRLWVRETWAQWAPHPDHPADTRSVIYRADQGPEKPARWVPAIHMFRWASRLTLEVTGVRVERLQDISEADAIAEGIERVGTPWKDYGTERSRHGMGWVCAQDSYRSLWESINGAGSWDANPWVWVIEFKRLTEEHQK